MAIATRTTDPIAASLACLRGHLPPGSRVIVFGSQARGEARDDSDLDLLVDPSPETTLFDLGGLQAELEALLGVPVDVLTPGDLPARFRAQVLAEARPV